MPLKLMVLGSAQCGKTTWLRSIQKGQFDPTVCPTTIIWSEVIQLISDRKAVVYDVSGSERIRALTLPQVPHMDGVLLCYDLQDAASLQDAQTWYVKIKNTFSSDIIICVVGLKSDRLKTSTKHHERAEYWIKRNCGYYELSSKKDDPITLLLPLEFVETQRFSVPPSTI